MPRKSMTTGFRTVKQIQLKAGMTVNDLVKEMSGAGVIGAGKVAKAVDIVTEMFEDPDYTVFLAVSGPLVPSGMRLIFTDLIRGGYVNAIVSNGANIVHDLVEAMGAHHLVGSASEDDRQLWKRGINRAYDIFIESQVFPALEKHLAIILDSIPEHDKVNMPIHVFLREIGVRLADEDSILYNAARHNVPVFSPGLLDSMIGIPMWMYSQRSRLSLNPIKDFELLARIVYDSKKAGAILLGGGTPKHHTLYVNTLREGLDAAVQISSAVAEDGSLSGAPLTEAISWGKVRGDKLDKLVSVFGDVTVIFPIIVAAVLERLERQKECS